MQTLPAPQPSLAGDAGLARAVSVHSKYQQGIACIRDSRGTDGVQGSQQANSAAAGGLGKKGERSSCVQAADEGREGRLMFCTPSCRDPRLNSARVAGACGGLKGTRKIVAENEGCMGFMR